MLLINVLVPLMFSDYKDSQYSWVPAALHVYVCERSSGFFYSNILLITNGLVFLNVLTLLNVLLSRY